MIEEWLSRMRGDVFIETGCKEGDTLEKARPYFDECHSIEINAIAHARCVERFRDAPHVHVHLGDSRGVLPHIIDPTRQTTFYLDAHCEGAPSTVPEADTECPLVREIQIIAATHWRSRPVVIVDDIEMFKDHYWADANSNHHLFTRKDWPTLEALAAPLSGYRYIEDAKARLGIWV